ncbi:MAG: hypothetical protein J6O00_10830 [Clostridiales bacterium]|nr:hypothetical protein [Clostridiales bacterium]
MSESTALIKAKEMQERLLTEIDDRPAEDIIRAMYKDVEGKVRINKSSTRYLVADGCISSSEEKYTSYNLINYMEPEHTKYDLKRLSEDLTYCFYLAQGGREMGYIPDLIKVLNDFESNMVMYNPEDPLQFSDPEEEPER